MRNKFAYSTIALLVAAMNLAGGDSARAVELLINGNLESSVSPPNFTLTQTVTGLPGATVSATEQISFANNPPGTAGALGLVIKPEAANRGTYADQNKMINIILTQTVTGLSAARDYTLALDSYFGNGDGGTSPNAGYSGGVTTLDPFSPSDPDGTGTVPSPTQTLLELQFLNAGGGNIGTPQVLDLRTGQVTGAGAAGSITPQMNDAMWRTATLPEVLTPPVGTAGARVTFSALNVVENFGFQSVYIDNFSLKDTTAALPAQHFEVLQNAGLNNVGPPNGYEIAEDPLGTDTLSFINFANHTPDGEQGMWLRAFQQPTPTPVPPVPTDGVLSQTVAGVVGGNYTFSAWSLFEPGYSGSDALSGTQTIMKLEFLDNGAEIVGATQTLELRAAGQLPDTTWRQYSVSGAAPANTDEVRVTAAGLDMKPSAINPQSAFFDDLSLDGPAPVTIDPDLDGDGDIDGNDLLLIQRGLGTTTTAAHFTAFQAEFGSATIAAGAVPEPATVVGAMLALFAVAAGRRRRA